MIFFSFCEVSPQLISGVLKYNGIIMQGGSEGPCRLNNEGFFAYFLVHKTLSCHDLMYALLHLYMHIKNELWKLCSIGVMLPCIMPDAKHKKICLTVIMHCTLEVQGQEV